MKQPECLSIEAGGKITDCNVGVFINSLHHLVSVYTENCWCTEEEIVDALLLYSNRLERCIQMETAND